jgi:hypothetical protein
MNDTTVVVAVFERRAQADGAIDELWHAGFAKEQIGLAAPGEPTRQASTATEALEETAASGAAAGAVTGSALGGVLGTLAVAAIPGLGPVLVGGLLGMAAGAALGSFAGPFVALGLSDETVKRYHADLAGGRSIVVLHTDRPEEALTILRGHGPRSLEVAGRPVAFAS